MTPGEPFPASSAFADGTWIGRESQDPYGEPLGTVLEILRDRSTGAPEWLLLADGDDREGRLAPIMGALPTGRKIRVAATASDVRAAPRLALGEELALQGKREAAQHYGLRVEMQESASGRLTEPGSGGRGASEQTVGAATETALGETQRRAIAARLAAAHAMEQASLKLLAAMRWRVRDEELVHDLALHHRDTRRHAEVVRARLDALGSPRLRPLDWLAKLTAYMRAQIGRLRSVPEAADLRAARDFERREIAAYEELERVAAQAGDELTCAAARAIRADEQAMVTTIEHSRLWRDPGLSRGQDSPFEAPHDLQDIAPRS
jgi:ferritin-like metal-binding protein YciE